MLQKYNKGRQSVSPELLATTVVFLINFINSYMKTHIFSGKKCSAWLQKSKTIEEREITKD